MGWNRCCVGQCVHQNKYYSSAKEKRKRVWTHHRKPHSCRVPSALPSVRTRALGKESLGRVPTSRHSANTRHTACRKFAECRPSAKIEHSAYFMFAECRWARTRQRLHMCPSRATNVRWPLGRLTAVTICWVLTFWHSAKSELRWVPVHGTRQRLFRRVPIV